MRKLLVCLGALCLPLPTVGLAQQTEAAPPRQPATAASARLWVYESAFTAYRPYQDQRVLSWTEVNRDVTPQSKRVATPAGPAAADVTRAKQPSGHDQHHQ